MEVLPDRSQVNNHVQGRSVRFARGDKFCSLMNFAPPPKKPKFLQNLSLNFLILPLEVIPYTPKTGDIKSRGGGGWARRPPLKHLEECHVPAPPPYVTPLSTLETLDCTIPLHFRDGNSTLTEGSN